MRNPLLSLYVRSQVALANRRQALRNRFDRGAGMVEYAAIIVLVGGIAVLIFGLGLDDRISGAIDDGVTDALGGE